MGELGKGGKKSAKKPGSKPSEENRRQRKPRLRYHCATCGIKYKKPKTWAYCSKLCERGRSGLRDHEPELDDVDGYLRLVEELEVSPPWRKEEIRNELAKMPRSVRQPTNKEIEAREELKRRGVRRPGRKP